MKKEDLLNLLAGNIITVIYVLLFFDFTYETIHLPLEYESDILLYALIIKNILLSLNPYYSPYLNAPFEGKFYDYPFVSILDYILIIPLSPITKNPFLAINFYITLSYILIFNFTYYTCRRLNLDPFISLLISFIYNIIPYHYMRSIVHPFLSIYIASPLTLLLCAHSSGYIRLKMIEIIISVILISISNLYYVFFSLISITFFSILSYLEEKKFNIIKNSFYLTLTIFSLHLLNYIPTLIFQIYEGYSIDISRGAWEAEVYGLKLIQMFLPPLDSKFGLNYIANYYNNTAIFINENKYVFIGIIGTIGFLLPLFVSSFSVFFNRLSKLNLFLFLFATTGGLSSFFSYAIISHFRGTNRVITLISLISFMLLFVKSLTFLEKSNLNRWIVKLMLLTVALVITFELTPEEIGKFRIESKTERFHADIEFSKKIADILKPMDMVYILPYTHFLEDRGKFAGGDYSTLRPSLHLSTFGIRVSNVSMKGREDFYWHRWLNTLSIEDMITVLYGLNFSGLIVDYFEIPNYGAELKLKLTQILKDAPVCDRENRLCFYDLRKYKNEVELNMQEKKLIDEAKQKMNINMILGRGFYDEEKSDNTIWIWAKKRGEINFINRYSTTKKVKVSIWIEPYKKRNIKATLNDKIFMNEDGQPISIEEEFLLKPGVSKLIIEAENDEVAGGGDIRRIGFKIINPEFYVLD